jgi:hypothetical protein
MAAASAALFACAPPAEDATADAPPPCPTPADSVIGGALEKFIVTRDPVPHSFLVPIGTPEAIPDRANYPLYAGGRTQFLWPPDSALQEQQISNMRAKGKHVTMVLGYAGRIDTLPDGRMSVGFTGRYVDLANENAPLQEAKIYFDCQAMGESRFTVGDQMAAGGAPAGGGGGGGG